MSGPPVTGNSRPFDLSRSRPDQRKPETLSRIVTNMAAALASLFLKRVSCPSSQTLLDYDQSRIVEFDSHRIEAHLANCDFCNAELQLLTRYSYDRVESLFVEMPAQLRKLAEALLKRSDAPFNALSRLEENPKI